MSLLKEIVESPALLKEIYGDVAKPGVSQVGKAIGTLLGLGNTALWPVALLNEKAKLTLEANLERYREKIQDVGVEEICEVPPEVGVPIAEKLSYVSNEDLSEMYTELLAKASKTMSANVAHPSFVNIINNLSPDEAILLKSIKHMNGIPFIEVRANYEGKTQWTTLDPMMVGVPNLEKLAHPSNVQAYFSNLEGLGIFQIRTDIFMVGEGIYEPLENFAHSKFDSLIAKMEGRELKLPHGKIEITQFGRLFMAACITEKKT